MPQSAEGLYARAQAVRWTAERTQDPKLRQQYQDLADQLEGQIPDGALPSQQQRPKSPPPTNHDGIYGWLKGLFGY